MKNWPWDRRLPARFFAAETLEGTPDLALDSTRQRLSGLRTRRNGQDTAYRSVGFNPRGSEKNDSLGLKPTLRHCFEIKRIAYRMISRSCGRTILISCGGAL